MTYAARIRNTRARVAIKELFPSDFVVRSRKGRVLVQTAADEDIFREAMRMFRQEANILSQVEHENVVRVIDYLEANGTAYMVMEYEDGYNLTSIWRCRSRSVRMKTNSASCSCRCSMGWRQCTT